MMGRPDYRELQPPVPGARPAPHRYAAPRGPSDGTGTLVGNGDDTTAAKRLRLLQKEFTQPGRSVEPGGRTSPTVTASAPLRLGIIDYIGAQVGEVVAHARTDMPDTHPDATPQPTEPAAVYGWWQSMPVADENRRDARDQVIYRQCLEHAILMGDHKVVRPHPCPECECWGLLWDTARRRAVCTNLDCVDKNGLGHAWTLKRLAYEHVTSKRILKTRAT